MKRAVGFENSNSAIKVYSENKVIHYPNTIKKMRNQSQMIKIPGMKQMPSFEVNGQYYQVGMPDGYGSGSKDESRYGSDQFVLESIIGLSQSCNHGDDLKVITGLPANLSNRDDVKHKLVDALVGTHAVKVDKAIKRFAISEVNVVSQPVGTLWTMFFDINGYFKIDKTAMQEQFLIIDIGWGTTDLVALSSAGVDYENTNTLDIATGDYIKKLHQTIEQEIPKSRLTAKKITPYLLDELLRETDILNAKGTLLPVGDIKRDLQIDFSNDLKLRFDNYNYTLDAYHKVIFTGGGSGLMKDILLKQFDNSIVIENPVLANVTGFYIMAKQKYRV